MLCGASISLMAQSNIWNDQPTIRDESGSKKVKSKKVSGNLFSLPEEIEPIFQMKNWVKFDVWVCLLIIILPKTLLPNEIPE